MTKWTEEQRLAIDKNGQNIIVSAGAGSGKTAVLTERVIETLKRGISINNLLILTFTNKAAYEMKDRIRDAISKEEKVKNELDYIDSSYISTFDSFSLSIVKKYSYLLNIGKKIDIADSSIIYLEKKKIIDDIFEKMYKNKNKEFLKLINDFTIKKDDDIKKYIINISDSLDLKYDKKEFLNNYIYNYYSNSNIDLLIENYIDLLKNKIEEINDLLNEFSYMVDIDYFASFKSLFDDLFNSDDYYSIRNNLSITFPNAPRNSSEEAKETKKKIVAYVDELINLTKYEVDELKDILMSTKDYAEAIIEVIKELDERLFTIKKEMNLYDFSDISKMGIKILKENENVREELKNHFYEIMIDEYQDTSDLQEEFISLIANNNVYVVGDIKQSIYGFRNANPYLFKNKYDNYSMNNNGFKIDLTKNFRSRDEVVTDINTLFSHLMTDSNGGASYKETHQMIAGNTTYLEEGKTNQNNNLEIINYDFDPALGYTKEEIEIFYIAKDIKKKIDNKYQIFDKKTQKLRDVNYGDFTIILDRNSSFPLYKKIFQYLSLPLTINTASNIVLEDEIVLIKNILKLLISNKEKKYDIEFDYAFMSIARSYLFEMSDEEIFDIITNKNYSSDLMNVINSITINIDTLSLNEIIYEIVEKFDFYSKFILIGDVNSRINRITSIIKIFNNLSLINYSIYDAYEYFNELIDDQYKIEVKVQDSISNSVKIMNIHMSKGLEFPICYYAGLNKAFNKSDLKDRFIYSKKYGIVTPYFKEGIGNTFIKELVKNDYNHEDISERIRLFYVALTRAREKMIIVTSIPDKMITNINKTSSFLDFLIYSKDVINKYIKNIEVEDLNISRDYNFIKTSNYQDSIEKTDEKLIIKELDIKSELLTSERISKETHSLINKEIKEKMEFGTKMHEILELIDFNNPNYDELDIDDYFKDKIKNFIAQINVKDLENIYKEYEFMYEKDNNVYHGIIDLILEYKDKISIIDYKLKNIDDENYIKQLNSYKDYLSLKTNKKIDIYLFSIISGTLSEIKENM